VSYLPGKPRGELRALTVAVETGAQLYQIGRLQFAAAADPLNDRQQIPGGNAQRSRRGHGGHLPGRHHVEVDSEIDPIRLVQDVLNYP